MDIRGLDGRIKDDTQEDEFDLHDVETAKNPNSMPIEIPSGHHKLQQQYWLWFSKKAKYTSYEQSLKLIGKFASVEQFWAIYGHLVPPSQLPEHCEFHLFKLGVKPMWEDASNSNGGRWILRLRKGIISRCWENLVLAMIGEQFMVGEEICGCVASIRNKDDMVSIWNKTASDQSTITRIGDTLRRVLNLPPNSDLDYKPHKECIMYTTSTGS